MLCVCVAWFSSTNSGTCKELLQELFWHPYSTTLRFGILSQRCIATNALTPAIEEMVYRSPSSARLLEVRLLMANPRLSDVRARLLHPAALPVFLKPILAEQLEQVLPITVSLERYRELSSLLKDAQHRPALRVIEQLAWSEASNARRENFLAEMQLRALSEDVRRQADREAGNQDDGRARELLLKRSELAQAEVLVAPLLGDFFPQKSEAGEWGATGAYGLGSQRPSFVTCAATPIKIISLKGLVGELGRALRVYTKENISSPWIESKFEHGETRLSKETLIAPLAAPLARCLKVHLFTESRVGAPSLRLPEGVRAFS